MKASASAYITIVFRFRIRCATRFDTASFTTTPRSQNNKINARNFCRHDTQKIQSMTKTLCKLSLTVAFKKPHLMHSSKNRCQRAKLFSTMSHVQVVGGYALAQGTISARSLAGTFQVLCVPLTSPQDTCPPPASSCWPRPGLTDRSEPRLLG